MKEENGQNRLKLHIVGNVSGFTFAEFKVYPKSAKIALFSSYMDLGTPPKILGTPPPPKKRPKAEFLIHKLVKNHQNC
jgi:hypothetical protein